LLDLARAANSLTCHCGEAAANLLINLNLIFVRPERSAPQSKDLPLPVFVACGGFPADGRCSVLKGHGFTGCGKTRSSMAL
jgi:hypothetical protein